MRNEIVHLIAKEIITIWFQLAHFNDSFQNLSVLFTPHIFDIFNIKILYIYIYIYVQ